MLRLMDQCMEGASLIDISSMAKSHDHYEQNAVVDRIKDSIIAHPEAVTLSPTERSRRRRMRILGK